MPADSGLVAPPTARKKSIVFPDDLSAIPQTTSPDSVMSLEFGKRTENAPSLAAARFEAVGQLAKLSADLAYRRPLSSLAGKYLPKLVEFGIISLLQMETFETQTITTAS